MILSSSKREEISRAVCVVPVIPVRILGLGSCGQLRLHRNECLPARRDVDLSVDADVARARGAPPIKCIAQPEAGVRQLLGMPEFHIPNLRRHLEGPRTLEAIQDSEARWRYLRDEEFLAPSRGANSAIRAAATSLPL